MVVVDGAEELDRQTLRDASEGSHVHLKIATVHDENIEQLLVCPGLDVQSVEVTPHQVLGHPSGEQKRVFTAPFNL